MSIHVGLCADTFPPIVDGVNQVLQNYGEVLCAMGDDVTVITPQTPGAVEVGHAYGMCTFRSFPLPPPYVYRWGIASLDRGFMRRMREIPLDIVHAHSPFSSDRVAMRLAKERGVPLVASFHTKYRDDFEKAFKVHAIADGMARWVTRTYRAADEVWAVNAASVAAIREYGYDGPVTVMENGCDMPLTPRDAEARRAVLSRYALPDAPLAGFVGRLNAQKNIGMLIEAEKILKARGELCSLMIIGGGEEQERLQAMVREGGLEDRVRFAGTVRDRDALRRLYQAMNVVMLPSAYDTSSLVPREASSCGCPALLIKGTSTAQGVSDGENGYLAEGTADDFARRLGAAIRDPEAMAAVGEGARRTLYRTWKTAVGEARERYIALIEKKKR